MNRKTTKHEEAKTLTRTSIRRRLVVVAITKIAALKSQDVDRLPAKDMLVGVQYLTEKGDSLGDTAPDQHFVARG